MDELKTVEIELKISGGGFVSAGNLSKISYLCDYAAYETELEELSIIRNEFTDIPVAAIDATELRLRKKFGSFLIIREASNGSIILAGCVITFTMWLLQQTLAETVKDAWKESEARERLKEFLLKQMGGKRKVLADKIKGELQKDGIEAEVEEKDGKIIIVIYQKEDESLSAVIRKKEFA